MVVNFEFLGQEPIENLITCMNFRVDKVVFFSYQETIDQQKAVTESFLRKHCGVKTVVFQALPQNDLQSVLNAMRKEVQHERSQNNPIYFDVTGGESLILVAFGMLSRELETPMHMYDVAGDRLIELDEGAGATISRDLAARPVPMTLDLLVEMHGGRINKKLHKEIKGTDDPDFMADVEKIYQIARQNWDYWNPFSDFLRNTMASGAYESLQVKRRMQAVEDALLVSASRLNSMTKLNELVDSLAEAGVLVEVDRRDDYYRFSFKNREIKNCLWEGGSILELHTCHKEALRSSQCMVGVHLDWDGVFHDRSGLDVLNEIDVLALEGNMPVFISCKSGKMGAQQSLHALYELETVAGRFGGKYARKVLVTAQGLLPVYRERAAEMGIEVR